MQRGGGSRARNVRGVQDGGECHRGDGGEPWVAVPGSPRRRLSTPPHPVSTASLWLGSFPGRGDVSYSWEPRLGSFPGSLDS